MEVGNQLSGKKLKICLILLKKINLVFLFGIVKVLLIYTINNLNNIGKKQLNYF